MNESDRNAAISIMLKIMVHPVMKPFLEQMETAADIFGDFPLSKPDNQDLNSILESLQNRRFTSTSEWMDCVENVWINGEQTLDNNIIKLASEARHIFKKAAKKFVKWNTHTWYQEITRLQKKLGRNVATVPMGNYLRWIGVSTEYPLTRQLQTENDIRNFMNAEKMLNPQEQEYLLQIIEKLQPELSNSAKNVRLNIMSLKPHTLNMAIKFVQEALKKRSVAYPMNG